MHFGVNKTHFEKRSGNDAFFLVVCWSLFCARFCLLEIRSFLIPDFFVSAKREHMAQPAVGIMVKLIVPQRKGRWKRGEEEREMRIP